MKIWWWGGCCIKIGERVYALSTDVQVLTFVSREGSTYLVHHNPDHRWYYLSNIDIDEAILIKVPYAGSTPVARADES
jgi:hypothetical protein